MPQIHIYVITVNENCEREAISDGHLAHAYKTTTDIDVWAYTKEEAVRTAEKYGKVLACYTKE